ncbi:MAG: manganese ABC transporter ATP-binding protein [Verrucomicrobia bacterium]|nr:MAG: manganese ABC transporter ATP-binding protein [Verrucomicrobiota bacterium]
MKEPYPLVIEHLSASYDRNPVISDINLKIPAGNIVGIVGPNGAGKSTLIKAVMGLIPQYSGKIYVFGQPFKKALKHVGYMPQRENIDWDFPVNVYDVVMMGRYQKLGLFRTPGKKDREIVEACIEKVDLTEFKERQISDLSGGQQQRVFLARALAQESDLYFMDEPFAGVDAKTERAIMAVLQELRNQGKTLIVIHHDLATVKDHFDYIVLINHKIIADGPIKEVFTLENLEKTYGGNLHLFREQCTS